MQLNPEQQKAVAQTEGPLLIIAGAGSGKTRVLTERLANIIESGLARPEETLTVTFTNKAAEEIKLRVLARLAANNVADIPWMGTFHSIAVKILRRNGQHIGLNNNFTIYDTDDQLSLVKKCMQKLNVSIKQVNPKAVLGAISSAKNELMTPGDYAQNAQGYFYDNVAVIYKEYQKQLMENQAVDFDDLLMYTVKLLEGVEEVRERYQQNFKYLMVDEYQDTNHAQYKMVSLLAPPQNNICVVGDDDQSIYAWRGATIRNILEFENDYPDAKVVKLEQNYRSTKKILAASNSVVSKISGRKDKKLWTENLDGENLMVYEAMDERDESYWLVDSIAQLIEQDVSPSEIVVLYRMNAQSRVLEEAFLKAAIPYKMIGNVRFYDRKEVKDMLAYLRVVYNPKDTVSLLRIINVPSRKIGDKTSQNLLEKSEQAEMGPIEYLLAQKSLLSPALRKFAEIMSDIIESAKDKNVTELIKYVSDRTGYMIMLDDGSEEGKQRIENINELVNVASKFRQLSPEASLQAFLEEVALVENTTLEATGNNNASEESQERVSLMTAHSAKGLEFDHVFVVGMEEGLFPHSRSMESPQDLDEERRLAYVAITRARHRVYLAYTIRRTVFGMSQSALPSRFIGDIETELIDFTTYTSAVGTAPKSYSKGSHNYDEIDNDPSDDDFSLHAQPGDTVSHQHFGRGRIVSINSEVVIVDFDRAGEKELATEFAGLVKM